MAGNEIGKYHTTFKNVHTMTTFIEYTDISNMGINVTVSIVNKNIEKYT